MSVFYRNACGTFSKIRTCIKAAQEISCTDYRSLLTAVNTIRHCSSSSSSNAQTKLMQFFDDEKNWHEEEVRVGRSWKTDDLRIKSNEDLHKLWFVLLKERNMLLTMEHACKQEVELFPNPERLDKVKESMENLETVVRERNRAYFELETGGTGERPEKLVFNQLGMRYRYRMSEHLIPKFMNRTWREKYKFGYKGAAVHKFLRLYREKFAKKEQQRKFNEIKYVRQLFKNFPNIDVEAVKKHHPNVDIDKIRQSKEARGNHENNG